MPTSHPTISEPSAHLTDPADPVLAIAAQMAALEGKDDDDTDAAGYRWLDLEKELLEATPTTPAGAVAQIRAIQVAHRGQHVEPDGTFLYENITLVDAALSRLGGLLPAMLGGAADLRVATWAQYRPSDDAAVFAVERELAEARKACRAIDEATEPKRFKAADDKIARLILKLLRTPASTPAGIIAKIMENADILPPDGSKDASFESYMVFHVLRDLRRMAEPKPAAPKRSRGSDIAGTGYRCHGAQDNPITYKLHDGTWRRATDDELRAELDARPWWCHNVSPATLRRLFPDGDGELVARIVECEEAGRAFDAVKLPAPKDEVEPLRMAFSTARDRVAEMEVRTVGGASLLLDWYKSHDGCLTQEQRWHVLWWVGRILADGFPCEPGEGRCLSVPLVVYPKPEKAEPVAAAPFLQAAE